MSETVSNTSPLIALGSSHRLFLLREMYGSVIIPDAVYEEVVLQGRGKPGAKAVEEAIRDGWIFRRSVSLQAIAHLLVHTLGPGESEALALACEIQADRLLLDEAEARRTADILGLPKIGVVGVLIRSRLENRIPSLREALLDLKTHCNFRLSASVWKRALQEVGESGE